MNYYLKEKQTLREKIMGKANEKNFDIKNPKVIKSINKLDGFLRAEYNTEKNYLDYYAGQEALDKVDSIKYQVIYGRRGTGKTHLLRALQERLLETKGNISLCILI
jgi:chromosomal replication initiation ATPase DnaA